MSQTFNTSTGTNATTEPAPIVWNLHGSSLLLAPRLPTGRYRVDIIDDFGRLSSVDGDTEQAARDAAEELVEKRLSDQLMGRQERERIDWDAANTCDQFE